MLGVEKEAGVFVDGGAEFWWGEDFERPEEAGDLGYEGAEVVGGEADFAGGVVDRVDDALVRRTALATVAASACTSTRATMSQGATPVPSATRATGSGGSSKW